MMTTISPLEPFKGRIIGYRIYSHDDLYDYTVYATPDGVTFEPVASFQDRLPADYAADALDTEAAKRFNNGFIVARLPNGNVIVKAEPTHVSDAYWNVRAGLNKVRTFEIDLQAADRYAEGTVAEKAAYEAEQAAEATLAIQQAVNDALAAEYAITRGTEVTFQRGRGKNKVTYQGTVEFIGDTTYGYQAKVNTPQGEFWTKAVSLQPVF